MAIFLTVVMVALLAVGTPVPFALVLTGIGAVLAFGTTSLTNAAQAQFGALDSFVLLAIPFFILAANVMVQGRLAAALFDFMHALARPVAGGAAVGGAVASALFSAISGSSVASAAALGRVTIPELDRLGYPRRFSTGLMAAGGALGNLIPPSIVFVIYGAMAQVPVTDLFIAGTVPGLLLAAMLAAVSWAMARRHGWNPPERASLAEIARTGRRAVPALTMIVIILGGIYSGWFTPTEAAAVSVLYGLLVAFLVHRTLTPAALPGIFIQSAKTTGAMLLILATSIFIGMLSTMAGIPAAVFATVEAMQLDAWQFLLVVNLVLLVLGTFLDGVTILVVLTPILLPTVKALGIDLVHFAVILTLNIEIAGITPPVGMNLFVISAISRTPLDTVFRGSLLFTGVMVVGLVLVTYLPALSLFAV